MDVCSAFNKCGGCQNLGIDYQIQLETKETKVLQLFEQSGITIEKYEGITPSPNIYHYRNKMEYSFGNEYKDGPLNIGLKGRKRLIDVYYAPDCMIAPHDFNTIVSFSREFFLSENLTFRNFLRHQGYLRHLSVRQGTHTHEILVHLSTDKDYEKDHIVDRWAQMLTGLKLEGTIKGILHSRSDTRSNMFAVENTRTLYGQDLFHDKIEDLSFKISTGSFFQTNTRAAEKLYGIVLEKMGECTVAYDLYSGTGTISLLLSKKAKKVYSIEIVPQAVAAAKQNALDNNIQNVDFICSDVKDAVENIKEKPQYVVLDPPRAGLHPDVIRFLQRKKFQNIIYVSCNPQSLVQNLKDLGELYQVKTLNIVDMFPHTEHVETVVLMSRAKD